MLRQAADRVTRLSKRWRRWVEAGEAWAWVDRYRLPVTLAAGTPIAAIAWRLGATLPLGALMIAALVIVGTRMFGVGVQHALRVSPLARDRYRGAWLAGEVLLLGALALGWALACGDGADPAGNLLGGIGFAGLSMVSLGLAGRYGAPFLCATWRGVRFMIEVAWRLASA
ncbi:MAG: hypothetical protein ACRCT8_02635 [Lacipirellulaceae bacterium]